ncbi:GNAT family N-acetyltransferase [Microbacterium sp. BK668]|uniref:GNAT family N-acetyltransferase n=1 Tax=Microbacterium sp. BK668 TaxID=2512118 RepID=UPI0010620EB0|nr:GNAT family N-acetyltransferase [Microbacterium sp. BK668]TDN91023.1 RimJ/RimL family protein N-acetyltransferase [Microbacterium sp. BK668]
MSSIELRALDDDDLDAIFEMMRDPEAIEMAAFTASDPDDRGAFDDWIARHRASADVADFVVTERGAFAGTAALFSVDGDRELTFWITRHAWGRGVASETVRLLVSHEPIRPLFARAAAHNGAALAVLQRNGFTEVSRSTAYAPGVGREVEEVVLTLVPTLDGI